MKAELAALHDMYNDVDLVNVHLDVWAQAREQRKELVAAIRARNDMVVSVAECARRLGVKKNRITGLVERNHVWHDKRRMWSINGYRMSRVVREVEVRMKLAEIDAGMADSEKPPKKKEPVPAGWIPLVDFAEMTAARRATLTGWCKRKKMRAAKFVISRMVGHASREWCVPLDESIMYLRQVIADSRARIHGGSVIRPDPRVEKTPLIESIWQEPKISLEVCAFWRQKR